MINVVTGIALVSMALLALPEILPRTTAESAKLANITRRCGSYKGAPWVPSLYVYEPPAPADMHSWSKIKRALEAK